MHEDQLILVAGALLAVGILASLLAGRVRLPALVLLIGVGMLLGSDGLGLIDFSDYDLARLVGVLALGLILFEGGLAAGWPEVRPVLWPSLSLALLGTIITAVVAGFAATWLFDFSTLEGMLVGSVLAATDGAAVFALMKASSLRKRLARTLEAEAGLNDPVAVLLVIGFIEWLQRPDYGVVDMAGLFGQQLGIAVVFGLGIGWLATKAFVRVRLDTPGLYPVASIATAALAYGAAASLDGSGFMAVYLAGLTLGSSHIPARRTITTFHEGMAWVAQLSMFLILGLLVFPGQLVDVALEGTVLALILVFVARPLAVLVSTAGAGYEMRERALIGWAGLRGAVPVVLATFPVIDDIPGSLEFFNIVFFAVLLSTVLQGTTVETLARRLRLTTVRPAVPSPVAETGTIRRLGAEVIEYSIDPEDAIVGNRIRELGLPRDALVNVIVRGMQAIPPRGSTVLEAGDRLHILVRRDAAAEVEALFDRWHEGPITRPGDPTRRVPAY
jgi:potassium/hydrogen antiporter